MSLLIRIINCHCRKEREKEKAIIIIITTIITAIVIIIITTFILLNLPIFPPYFPYIPLNYFYL